MRLITATLALATVLAFSAAPAFAWSGCKVGAFAGYGITHTTATASTPLAPISATIDGLSTENPLGGVALGCDVQLDKVVIGAFADYAFQDAQWKTTVSGFGSTLGITTGLGDQWAIGGRIGYTATPTTLVFATVGWTEAKADPLAITLDGTTLASFDVADAKGWFLGGGFESEISKRIYLSMEYRFTRFDDRNVELIPGVANLGLDTDQHQVRLGLAIKFGPTDTTAFGPMK